MWTINLNKTTGWFLESFAWYALSMQMVSLSRRIFPCVIYTFTDLLQHSIQMNWNGFNVWLYVQLLDTQLRAGEGLDLSLIDVWNKSGLSGILCCLKSHFLVIKTKNTMNNPCMHGTTIKPCIMAVLFINVNYQLKQNDRVILGVVCVVCTINANG